MLWLGVMRQQAITWVNVDPLSLCRITKTQWSSGYDGIYNVSKNVTCVNKECVCFCYVLPVYKICPDSATLTLMQTASDSTEYKKIRGP